jgi:hypothetical protein
MRRYLTTILVIVPLYVLAQEPSAPDTGAALPVRKVVLYKSGVGYFEHLGNVRDRQAVAIRFTSAQLNDALNSLTVLDLGKGQITGISYNSVAPLEQRLGALRLPLDESTTQARMLGSLRGARIEVTSASGAVLGRLLSVEQRTSQRGESTTTIDAISIVTDAGELRSFDLSPTVRVRIVERDLRQEIGRYLDVVGTIREQDVRRMVISTAGDGERPLFVSYVSEVPIWKSSYRLVFGSTGKPLLQGWAIIDNTIGEDWRNVELSLVAGAPQSFIQNISQPHYSQRPVVPVPSAVLLAPQTHAVSLGEGLGSVRGTIRDVAGSIIPGASVQLAVGSRVVASTTSTSDGRYELTAPPGTYSLRIELAGFSRRVFDNWRVTSGASAQQDVTLQVGSQTETVKVAGESGGDRSTTPQGWGGGTGGGAYRAGAAPAPPPAAAPMPVNVYEQSKDISPQALAASLGDLFEYQIKEPVSLGKNQSALVPIVNAAIDAEKVSLWNQRSGSGRPLRAVWLTNVTGLTLDGGSMTLIDDDAFAGEGLLASLKPNEKRLLSYASDLGVMVDMRRLPTDGRLAGVRARDGILITETEERATSIYRARNENGTPTALIIEHHMQPGWNLADGQTPVESTADAQRFRVTLPTGKETVFEVREVRHGEARLTIGNVDDGLVARLAKSGIPAATLERSLKPVIDKKAELSAIERRLSGLTSERNTITQDQQRLRENMKSLKGSNEEKQLLQRYTRQLDQQETRLEALHNDVARATAELEKERAEFTALIANITFEWTNPQVGAPRGDPQ